ncbi:MAG: guanylate kinase [Oscillospiraceae bacterium]|jgi:guanylate kinase|nr:guanylate kinase [Oscillospiraceae bacterium]
MADRKGKLIIISAPSGAGKGTVIREMMKRRPELRYSVSATTRQPRAGEIDGVHYHFITRERFLEMISRGEFFEHAEYVNNFYGTPRDFIENNIANGADTILEIEIEGARNVRAAMPEALSVFVMPPSGEELERRLRTRGAAGEDDVQRRLARAKVEMLAADEYDRTVVNGTVSETAEQILKLIDES